MNSYVVSRWKALFPDHAAPDQFLALLLDAYAEKQRHYHDSSHIENMLRLSETYAQQLKQHDVVALAILYHDIIYDPLKSDNEERSADRAVDDLTGQKLPQETIREVKRFILATKKHEEPAGENDLCFFLDFDLSALGASWEVYAAYAANIRKEYSIYPDLVYKPGRKKVLKHFLEMPFIYKTETFRDQFDAQARLNLERELNEL